MPELEIMKDDFELSRVIINSLALKVRRLYRQGKNSIPIKVEKRVAAKLWKLSKDYGIEIEEGTLIDLNITVTYLADMFGAPRETISRSLKILKNAGLINSNREGKEMFYKASDNKVSEFMYNIILKSKNL